MHTLTRQQVRRLALRNQHLDAAPPPDLLDLFRDLGCVQLDPISRVERSHWLVLWSRLGDFDRATFAHEMWQERRLYEYWAHAASIVLTEDYPLHAWHMRQLHDDPFHQHIGRFSQDDEPQLQAIAAHVLAFLAQNGATHARDIPDIEDNHRFESAWYGGRYLSRVLDVLWSRGDVMVVGRKGKQRQWGLVRDYLPEWTPQTTLSDAELTRQAAPRAIRALGVATPKHIKYHFTRSRYPDLENQLRILTAEGILQRVNVVDDEGDALKGDWYIHADDIAQLDAPFAPRTTLLSPFDNLICDRARTEALWDFEFRIEIYVPEAKRQYGYYVLPILHGDTLIGRVHPTMDRKTKTLIVHDVYAEADAPRDAITPIKAAIADLGQFLGAEQITYERVAAVWR